MKRIAVAGSLAFRGGVVRSALAGVGLSICWMSPAIGQELYQVGEFYVDRSDTQFVVLNGEIEVGAAADFQLLTAMFPEANTLVLNSSGGLLGEAFDIAFTVFDQGFATYIPEAGACLSACAYIFLAGDLRVARGPIGVHQFSSLEPDDEGEAQVLANLIVEMLDAFDVSPEVRMRALTTPPDEIYIFTPAEVIEFGINRSGSGEALLPPAPSPALVPSVLGTLWTHNGSVVRLTADGASRQFRYVAPRDGLPVDAGTLLFEGVREGQRYSGTAYVFSAVCGAIGYSVSGPVSPDDVRVTMYGRAPVRDNDCRIVGYRDDVLVFEYRQAE